MSELPGGTVTFLFSDIEGSTRLLERLGDRYQELHRDHRRLLRSELESAGGKEVDAQGDAFFFSFARAREAVRGAVAAQRALGAHSWPDGAEVKVRMGLHTGEPAVAEEGYLGMDVVRAARIGSAGHGGQILLSETTRALVGNDLPSGVAVRELGATRLKDVAHERLFQLTLAESPGEFPPVKAETDGLAVDDLAEQIQRRVNEQILAGFDAKARRRSFGGVGLVALAVGDRDLPAREGFFLAVEGAVRRRGRTLSASTTPPRAACSLSWVQDDVATQDLTPDRSFA